MRSRILKVRVLVLLVLALLMPTRLRAQADENADFHAPEMLYNGTDIEQVSVPMLSLGVTIPLIHKKGRGLDFDINLTYNSHFWETTSFQDESGDLYWITTNITGPWNIGVPRMAMNNGYNVDCLTYKADDTCYQWVEYVIFGGSDGSMLDLADDSGIYITGGPPTRFWSSNGTYMRIPSVTYGSSYFLVPKLVYKDGTTVNAHYNPNNYYANDYSNLEDTNGNQIKCTWVNYLQPGICTDTLGDVVTFNYGGGQLQSISYTDSSGQPQTISFTWINPNIDLPWDDSGWYNDPSCYNSVPQTCWEVQPQYQPLGVLSQLTLPNNLTYSFHYVTNSDGSITEELDKITMPTGGYVRYTYGCSGAPSCIYESPAQNRMVYQRIVSSDGTASSEKTWTYAITDRSTVTDPLGNMQASWWASWVPPMLAQMNYENSSGTVLKQILQTVSQDNTAYTDPGLGYHIGGYPQLNNPRPTSTTTVLSDTNQQSNVSYSYGTYNNVSDQYEYDWGVGGSGSLLRHKTYTYLHDSNSSYGDLAAHIFDRVTDMKVYNGSGSLIAETQTTYDNPGPSSTSGVVQHDYTQFPSTYTARGNRTQESKWLNTTSSWLTTTHAYNDVGNLLSVTDPLSHQTLFDYTDNYYNYSPPNPTSAFITKITKPATGSVNHIERFQYYFHSGLKAAHCGENSPLGTACTYGLTPPQPDYASFNYDKLSRPLCKQLGDGGQTCLTYNESSLPITVSSSTRITGSLNLAKTTVYDGLGRVSQTQLTTPQGTVFADKTYDALGRLQTLTNPHFSASSPTDGTTTYTYDPLNRITQVANPDNTAVVTSYSGNCATAADEAGKTRLSCADALGRLTQVTEDPAGLNYQTQYVYDALNNLTNVSQNGSRQRTFTYDSLSRLTSSASPESSIAPSNGASVPTTYMYDADGNLASKTAPALNQQGTATVTTTYSYDAVNRLTQKSYSDGATFPVLFGYDQTNITMGSQQFAISNSVGRLSWTCVFHQSAPYCPGMTATSYDPMGRIAAQWQCDVSCSTNYQTSLQYDYAGDLTLQAGPATYTLTQTFDAAGRTTGLSSSWVDSQHPATLATVDSTVGFWPDGTLRKVTLGNGLSETAALNNRLQPCRLNVNSTASYLSQCTDSVPSGSVEDFTLGFNVGTSDNGNVVSMIGTGQQSFNRSYTYDTLNRLLTMSAPGDTCSGLSWAYDAWGNRTAQTSTGGSCTQWSQAMNAQNRITGYSYDTAGNLLNDGVHSYSYDAENRLTAVDGGATATYTYDAQGKRIAKTAASTTTNYVYDSSGRVVGDIQGTNWVTLYIYFDRGLLAEYTGGTTYFVHKDHLGSTRLLTAMNQTTFDSMDYLPYGEQIAGDTGTTHKFAGKERDSETGLDNFGARYKSSRLGRFMTPDPLYVETRRLAYPQSLNLYAYARNNPLALSDPTGLDVKLNCDILFTCFPAIRDINLRKGAKFQVELVDGKLKVKKGSVQEGIEKDKAESALLNAINDTNNHATINVVENTGGAAFGTHDSPGVNTVDMQNLAQLDKSSNAGGLNSGDVLAHEAMDAYFSLSKSESDADSAAFALFPGLSKATNYVNTFDQFKTITVATTFDQAITNGTGTERVSFQYVTPIPASELAGKTPQQRQEVYNEAGSRVTGVTFVPPKEQ